MRRSRMRYVERQQTRQHTLMHQPQEMHATQARDAHADEAQLEAAAYQEVEPPLDS